jgi:uncharacterized membrane protein YvbJ
MFCKHCGTQLKEEAKFCPDYGQAVPVVAAAQQDKVKKSFMDKLKMRLTICLKINGVTHNSRIIREICREEHNGHKAVIYSQLGGLYGILCKLWSTVR